MYANDNLASMDNTFKNKSSDKNLKTLDYYAGLISTQSKNARILNDSLQTYHNSFIEFLQAKLDLLQNINDNYG